MSASESQPTDAPKTAEEPDRSQASDAQDKAQESTTKPEAQKEASPAKKTEDKPVEPPKPLPIRTSNTNPTQDEKSVPLSPKNPPAEAASTTDSTKPPPYTPGDTYIAVIGETGVGKSTFIRDVTGLPVLVGHDLESCTQEAEEFETTIDGRAVKLIDTPGFNDDKRDDATILEIIGTYLKQANDNEVQLTAVIYLQWITDRRIKGSAIKNLRILKLLCGREYYMNIVLVTVGWDDPPKLDHINLEKQLKTRDKFWGEFLTAGATVRRHTHGHASALQIVRHALGKTPMMLKFQNELAKVGIIARTAAGEEVIKELALEAERQEQLIATLGAKLKESEEQKQELERQIQRLYSEVAHMVAAMKHLETKLEERIEQSAHLQEVARGGPRERDHRTLAQCVVQ